MRAAAAAAAALLLAGCTDVAIPGPDGGQEAQEMHGWAGDPSDIVIAPLRVQVANAGADMPDAGVKMPDAGPAMQDPVPPMPIPDAGMPPAAVECPPLVFGIRLECNAGFCHALGDSSPVTLGPCGSGCGVYEGAAAVCEAGACVLPCG